MRNVPTCLAIVLLVAVASACANLDVDTVWDTQVDFAALRTYDWAPKEPEAGPELPYDEIDTVVREAVDRELEEAGFRRTADNPSFRVTYYIGVEEVAAITERAYYGPGWGGYWGYGWYGSVGLNMSQYDAGAITVDLLSSDPAIGLIWRGVAPQRIIAGQAGRRLDRALRRAVRKLFDDFPPELAR